VAIVAAAVGVVATSAGKVVPRINVAVVFAAAPHLLGFPAGDESERHESF